MPGNRLGGNERDSVWDSEKLRCFWVIQVKMPSKHGLMDCSITGPGLNEDRFQDIQPLDSM